MLTYSLNKHSSLLGAEITSTSLQAHGTVDARFALVFPINSPYILADPDTQYRKVKQSDSFGLGSSLVNYEDAVYFTHSVLVLLFVLDFFESGWRICRSSIIAADSLGRQLW